MFKQVLFLISVLLISIGLSTNTQKALAQTQEVGLWIGSGTYFGDINPDFSFRNTRPAFGGIYRYTVNDYITLRAGIGATRLEHADSTSRNPYQQLRNLSFRTNVFELTGQIDLHFKRFEIKSKKYYATPYLTLGLSAFMFNPKAQYQGEWYDLRELGTEGQQNTDVSGRTPYKKVQAAIPIGIGYKQWMRGSWSFYAELAYRQTLTDYLDDVSKTYVDTYLLGDGTITEALADRSIEGGATVAVGDPGQQRGDRVANDAYLMFQIGITYAIFNNKCVGPK